MVNTYFEHVPHVGVFVGKIPEYIGLSNARSRIRIGFLRRAKRRDVFDGVALSAEFV